MHGISLPPRTVLSQMIHSALLSVLLGIGVTAIATPRGLCVFDVDKTLTRGPDATPEACCAAQQQHCLSPEPYTTYCSGEHPSPDDHPRSFECRPSCRCGTPNCSFNGQCPFFNDTRVTNSTMGGNSGSNCVAGLTHDGRTRQMPAAYARGAIQKCLDRGMAVGVATAELYDPAAANREFLQGLSLEAFPDEAFDALSCSGPKPCPDYLLQWGEPFNPLGKPKEIRNLIRWLAQRDIPPSCLIFFDDNQNNAWSAVEAGSHSMGASTNCKGDAFLCCDACGLTSTNFDEGWQHLVDGHKYTMPDGGNKTLDIQPCPLLAGY